MRQTCTDNTTGQDLINVMGCFSQLVPWEFRRGSIALNPVDRTFPLPTYSHSYQWSISIRLCGNKFSLLFFITAGILQHREMGRRKERTNAKYLCKPAPDSYNLHEPPLILTNAGEISSLPSKAANFFRQMTRVGSHLRVLLLALQPRETRREDHFLKGRAGKEEPASILMWPLECSKQQLSIISTPNALGAFQLPLLLSIFWDLL